MNMLDRPLKIGLVSISDRASTGVYKDEGLPSLEEWFKTALITPWTTVTRLIPDDQALIARLGWATPRTAPSRRAGA